MGHLICDHNKCLVTLTVITLSSFRITFLPSDFAKTKAMGMLRVHWKRNFDVWSISLHDDFHQFTLTDWENDSWVHDPANLIWGLPSANSKQKKKEKEIDLVIFFPTFQSTNKERETQI